MPTTKKVARKPTVKKAVRKSVRTKQKVKVPKVANKKTTKTKSGKNRNKSKKNKELVSLPSGAGVRLQEKVKAAESLLDRLTVPVYRVAIISAVGFVLIAGATLSAEYLPSQFLQTAQTCTAAGCDTNDPNTDPTPPLPDGNTDYPSGETFDDSGQSVDNNESSDGQTDIEELDFDLFDSIPEYLEGTVQISFRVTNASSVSGEVINTQTGVVAELPITSLSSDNYRLVLNSSDFEPGEYDVVLIATSIGQQIIVAGEFIVGPIVEEQDDVFDPENVSGVSNDTEDDETGDTTPDNEDSDSVPSQNQDEDSIGVEFDTEIEEELTTDVFELTLSNTIFSGIEVIRVFTDQEFSEIELYVRPQQAFQALFLGSMNERSDFWVYTFDSNDLPNGRYELFALAENNEEVSSSESIVFEVLNQNVAYNEDLTSEGYEEDQSETEEQDEIQEEDLSDFQEIRDFYEIPGKDDDYSDQFESEVVLLDITRTLLQENKKEINDLLKRYAIAKQTENTLILDAILEEIELTRKSLLADVLNESDSSDIVGQIDLELQAEFEKITKRVDTFESIRQSRNTSVTSDSDGDGVSDFDEVNVYKTDPESADTDQDGFIDGAEVARGFDPVNPEPEAFIDYELPVETVGLERSDVLEVNSVIPVVKINSLTDKKTVTAEISGVGLPNSYVTLYVFSTPVIVTVKTDQDGSFKYRFDKELEDGDHEVFVAFTDNTGAILAHSAPFQFVKEAQAFSPVGVENSEAVVTQPSIVETSTADATKTVLGMSILVLGFMLLMLGINLRTTTRPEEQLLQP